MYYLFAQSYKTIYLCKSNINKLKSSNHEFKPYQNYSFPNGEG